MKPDIISGSPMSNQLPSGTACWFQFLRSRRIWSHLVWSRCLIWMWPWSNKRKSRLNRLQSRNLSRSVPCLRYMTWFNHYWIPQRITSYPRAVEVVTQTSRFERRSFPTQLWTMTFLTFWGDIIVKQQVTKVIAGNLEFEICSNLNVK